MSRHDVTLTLQAGPNPVWVAEQHGHGLAVVMRDYAEWIAGGDIGRNLDAVNVMFGSDSAPEPH